jgi:hypothetical protein
VPAALQKVAAAAVVALVFWAVSAIVAACSLDWSARSDAADSGVESGAEGGPPDGSPDRDAGDADAPIDDADAGQCALLAAEVATKRARAHSCVVVAAFDECKTTAVDECGCKIVVDEPEPAQPTVDFDDAVGRFRAAGCDAGCPASCPVPNADTIAPAAWSCSTIDGGTCYP